MLVALFGAPVSNTHFIEQPTVSSLKWLAVPRLDVNGQAISESDLGKQILLSGLLSKAKVVNGPIWIISGESNGCIRATVKLDIKDSRTVIT